MLYVSQVGQQPGAVAVGLKAAARHWGVTRALLCPTTRTLRAAERVRDYARNALPGVEVTVHEPEGPYFGPGGLEGLARTAVERAEGERLLFDVTPGLNFQVAWLSAFWRDRDDVVYQYLDDEAAWDLVEGVAYPLDDLGLEALLAFHGLSAEWAGESRGVLKDLVVRDARGAEVLRFGEAYERRGTLHGLVHIETKHEARALLASLGEAARAHGLRPRAIARCQRKADAMRLRADGVWAAVSWGGNAEDARVLREWRARRPPAPGQALGRTREESAEVDLGESVKGTGGDGPALLVCLGTDASATLTALATHRPGEAVVFYDRESPDVVRRAQRLLRAAPELAVGVLRLHPTDLRGGGIPEFRLESLVRGGDVLANVSPGSKAQAWALARVRGARLCSLKGATAVWCQPGLEGEVPAARKALPPTLVQADVQGGALVGLAADDEELRGRLRFLHLAARVVREIARRSEDGGWIPLRKHPPREPKASYLQVLREWDTGRGATARRWLRMKAVLRAGKGEEVAEGDLPGPADEGFWLEQVVAGALIAAGARDVVSGLRWGHLYEPRLERSPGRQGPEEGSVPFRTDIDVAGRFGEGFVAVSVKLGFPKEKDGKSREQWIERARQEVKAEARACLGRFTIPVLVRPVPRGLAGEEALWDVWREDGVLELPLSELGNTALIRELLERARNDLRSTRQAE